MIYDFLSNDHRRTEMKSCKMKISNFQEEHGTVIMWEFYFNVLNVLQCYMWTLLFKYTEQQEVE